MSKKKAAGKLRQQKRTPGKRLGLKMTSGQKAGIGAILVRQRGTKYGAGQGVGVGRDHTLYSTIEGTVGFAKKMGKTIVSVK